MLDGVRVVADGGYYGDGWHGGILRGASFSRKRESSLSWHLVKSKEIPAFARMTVFAFARMTVFAFAGMTVFALGWMVSG